MALTKLNARSAATLDAPILTGNLPAINGASLTSLPNNKPIVQVSLSANQTISTGVTTKIEFNTEETDSDGTFDNSTNYRFTVPSGGAGTYFVILSPTLMMSGGGYIGRCYLKKNTDLIARGDIRTSNGQGSSYTEFTPTTHWVGTLAEDDYIEGYGRIEYAAGTIAIYHGDTDTTISTRMGIFKLAT